MREPPYDAEMAVIGGVILDNKLFEKVSYLEPDDFHDARNQAVWEAVQTLAAAGAPIDEITLQEPLRHRGRLALIGPTYLTELGLRCPTSDNTEHYAGVVKEHGNSRRLQLWASRLIARVDAGAGYPELVSEVGAKFDELAGSSHDSPGTLADVVAGFGQRPPTQGLTTGLGIEHLVPGGIPSDKVTVLFGETGTFKTTIKNHILFTLARAGIKCLDATFEDSSELTAARYIAQLSSLPYGVLASGGCETPPVEESARLVATHIIDGSALRPDVPSIHRAARAAGVRAVFVDYLQLLDGCSQDHTEIAEVMRQAQLHARADNMAWVFLSQVKQDVHYRSLVRDKDGRLTGDPRPTINDCLGSSAIRTHSKLGLGVFRPWMYCKVPLRKDGPYGPYCSWVNNHPDGIERAMELYEGLLEIIVAKNVMGATGTVRVLVDPPTGRITPLDL